ncbi:MAG: hypothetical protein AABN34_08340 [Acidobacteriota bacterium]
MNNYLVSIATRTLNPDPPVRPRLGGRFEPASPTRELSIDNSEYNRPAAAKPSQPDSETDRAAIQHAPRQRVTGGEARESPSVAPEPDRAPSQQMNLPPVSRGAADGAGLSPSLLGREPNQQTPPKAESAQQSVHIEVRPVERLTDDPEHVRGGSSTSRKPRDEDSARSRSTDEPALKTFPYRREAVGEERPPTGTGRSSETIQPSLSRHDEEDSARPSIKRTQPGIEREIHTVVIREKSMLEESRLTQPAANLLPVSVTAAPSDAREQSSSKGFPIVVQSRIAPLAEVGPERLTLNRLGAYSQPTVHVTIGRIEVRAVQSSQSPAKPRATTPVMNLDDYLRRRNQGSAR